MTLPLSGEIGLQAIATEYEDTNDHNLTEFYADEFRKDSPSQMISNWKSIAYKGVYQDAIVAPNSNHWKAKSVDEIELEREASMYDLIIADAEAIPVQSTPWDYRGHLENRFDNFNIEVIISTIRQFSSGIMVVPIAEYGTSTYAYLMVDRNMGHNNTKLNGLLRLLYMDETTPQPIEVATRGISDGLEYDPAGDPLNDGNDGWFSYGPIRLLVQRRGDVIRVKSSNSDKNAWIIGADIHYDIKNLPADTGISDSYTRLRGLRAYGYGAIRLFNSRFKFIQSPSKRATNLPVTPWIQGNIGSKRPTNQITESIRLLPAWGETDPTWPELLSTRDISAMAFHERYVYFAVKHNSTTSTIYTYDIYLREIIRAFPAPGNQCDTLEYANGDLLSSSSDIYTVYVINRMSGTVLSSFNVPVGDAIYSIAYDGTDVYTVGYVSDRLYQHNGISGTRVNNTPVGDARNVTGLTVCDNLLCAISNFGSTTTMYLYGRDSVTGKFSADVKVAEIILSNEAYTNVQDIAFTGTNLIKVSEDRKGIDFLALDDSFANCIGVTDFYGYSSRKTITLVYTQAMYEAEYPIGAGGVVISSKFGPELESADYIFENRANIRSIRDTGFFYGQLAHPGHALMTGYFPEGSTLTIINKGTLIPAGGDGGGFDEGVYSYMLSNGRAGGNCIDMTMDITLHQAGTFVLAGGGGAHDGEVYSSSSSKGGGTTNYRVAGGGGGASGGIVGRAGPSTGGNVQYVAAAGTSTSGGRGGYVWGRKGKYHAEYRAKAGGARGAPGAGSGLIRNVDSAGNVTSQLGTTSGAGGVAIGTNGHTVTYI